MRPVTLGTNYRDGVALLRLWRSRWYVEGTERPEILALRLSQKTNTPVGV